MSSFAPEHESTQQFDTATQEPDLPNLRSSAARFGQWQMSQPEPHIDTSYVRDGFPDFTSHSPSELSIEVGRGVKTNGTPRRRGVMEDVSENPVLSMGNDSLYEITGTPPVRPRLGSRKSDSANRGDLRRQASTRQAMQQDEATKTSDIIPTKTRSQRRTVSGIHAKLNAASDDSFDEGRPQATVTMSTRNTRFGKRQVSAQAFPTRFTAGQGLDMAQKTPQRSTTAPNFNSAQYTGNRTQQSFILPDLPDITELVSGVRKDGTPVFQRTSKPSSRFASGSYRPSSNNGPSHAKIQSIPIPDEEKAIFASLQLLKEKVTQLEQDKEEAERRIEDYDNEVIELRSALEMEQKSRRGGSPSNDRGATGPENWRMERTRMQANIKALQDRLDRTDRKLAVSDIAVKRITQERDSLATQLGVAYYNAEEANVVDEELNIENERLHEENEELKAESEALRHDNNKFRVQIAHVKAQLEEETQHFGQREAELKSRLDRREEAVQEMKNLTNEIWQGQKASTSSRRTSSRSQREIDEAEEKEQRKLKRRSMGARLGQETQSNIMDKVEVEIRKARADAATKASKVNEANASKTRSRSKSQSRQPLSQSHRRTSSNYQAPAANDVSEVESTTDLEITRPVRDALREISIPNKTAPAEQDDTKDITYLSFTDANEIVKLRKKLEEERRARNQKRASSAPLMNEKSDTTRSATGTQSIPRKSSLRDLSQRLNLDEPLDENTDRLLKEVRIQSPNTSDAISYSEPNATTDASMLSTSSRRHRSKSFEEMTSAFILPDITLHAKSAPSTDAIPHNKATCTFCPHPSGAEPAIPTPVPVSDRNIDDTAATIRPSQEPATALATVLKQLEDEIVHLKLRLAGYESEYNMHDPAVGRKRREWLNAKIGVMRAEVERRSAQVYGLYDVLEGQKGRKEGEDGEGEEEEGNEETLQSLGIDPEELAERARKAQREGAKERRRSVGSAKAGWEFEAEDSEEELPWEGISDSEDEVDLGAGRRRSVHV
ncbi:hypothetical protein M8818_007252 [Zalaria obscura]|uniref:Uncharacterized protein n=1 Tax=Zalaria obscura TaxID=2024903 RepID=A0ACC3S7F8_9PEZI